jgi:hypothetical protein
MQSMGETDLYSLVSCLNIISKFFWHNSRHSSPVTQWIKAQGAGRRAIRPLLFRSAQLTRFPHSIRLSSSQTAFRIPIFIFILILVPCALFLVPDIGRAADVTLAWDPNDEPDVAGYIVYYGTASRDYNYDVDVGNYNGCTISGLAEDKAYYFTVTAYDAEGNESSYSEEIAYNESSVSPTGANSGGSGGSCFISTAVGESPPSIQRDPLNKFMTIPLAVTLLLTALLTRCKSVSRRRQH